MYRKYFLSFAFLFLLSACGNKKKPSLSGDEPVEIDDFIGSFETGKLPFEISDTGFNRKEKDSLLISQKIFKEFVPDSVITKTFGKGAKPSIYMIQKTEVENQEIYLFVKMITASRKTALVLCFNRDKKFTAFLPLLVVDNNPATTQISGMDRRYSFYKNTVLKRPDGTLTEGKEVYAYVADPGQFILIMTDALDDRVREVINPIDTLPGKNKLSADYVKDKMNIVSIRDGNRSDRLNFFIHFDNTAGECTGELKGVASLVSSAKAIYRQPGDACSLQFSFSGSSVTLKELEPCGSHRGVKCSFDGTYPRKKEMKKKLTSKKSS